MSFKEVLELLCKAECPATIRFDGAEPLYGCSVLSVGDDAITIQTERGIILVRRLSNVAQIELSHTSSANAILDALKKQ